MRRIATALALALAPLPASAQACPWLSADVAARVILAAPTDSKVEKNPVFGNAKGMESSTTCRFKAADELVGSLAVIVMEFGSYEAATAAYRRELAAQGSRAKPAKIGANPAFLTHNPGFSAASYAVKDKRLVFVNHAFSRRVNEAIGKDPDGAVLSTHEVARQVLGKL
jgi:hypothetical protein